jgi:hypothetical protein
MAGLEGIVVLDVTYLCNIGFNKLQAMAFDEPTPLTDQILDAAWSRSDPLQFKVEARRGIVDDIMMEDDGLSLVTFLEMNL